ncbi:hypothetical protein DCAR_0730141 [Daucus carota subsp. sativus]|uniref:Uncharacterized protein n=1 Tax=Daucus carota subsp. sativus TaxID=79200 RepID=A0AAF1BBZ3_DAUCS|nr:hypothetical protein DCAR_0730141 [Daucus carota subsp. sativus]
MPDTYMRNINEGAFAGHSVCLIETAAPAHLDPIPEYSSDDEIAAVEMSDKDWTGKERITLLHAWVSENLYDVALQLLEVEHHKKELALTTDKNALLVLAKNPPVFAGTAQSVFWRLLNTGKLSASELIILCDPDAVRYETRYEFGYVEHWFDCFRYEGTGGYEETYGYDGTYGYEISHTNINF